MAPGCLADFPCLLLSPIMQHMVRPTVTADVRHGFGVRIKVLILLMWTGLWRHAGIAVKPGD